MSRMLVLTNHTEAEQPILDELGIVHTHSVDEVRAGDVVFPRFRAIPFGDLLEAAVVERGAQLVNPYASHEFIAQSVMWRGSLTHGTPFWTSENLDEVDETPYASGPFFVKGDTNANKQDWMKFCYAQDRARLAEVIENNRNHPLIANQRIVIQPFLNFEKLGANIHEPHQPVINEWRFFCLGGEVVASGFYWSQQVTKLPDNTGAEGVVLDTLADLGKHGAAFVAVDVARLSSGEWRVIELNDANHAGLCGADEHDLWRNVDKIVQAW